MQPQENDHLRLMLAVFLAAMVLIGWQALVEWPKRQHLAQAAIETAHKRAEEKEKYVHTLPGGESAEDNSQLTIKERLAESPRLIIHSDTLHGSIALKGARFDDLTLAKYHESIDPNSPEVILFSPNGSDDAYFAQIGWVSPDNATKVPDAQSLWQADKKELTPGGSVKLSWNNGQGIMFTLLVSLDEHYMFDIAQHVENKSGHSVALAPYAYINRTYQEPKQQYAILHEGPLGVLEGSLEEINYKDLREKGNKTYEDASGWLGITDKYWQAALIPAGKDFKATFSHYGQGAKDRYQADYLAQSSSIESGGSADYGVRLFAGAKELKVLDHYTEGDSAHPPVPLFDLSVDFGKLWFLTKPMFHLLAVFHALVGNFGIAIMLLTIVVKLIMFPVANKSFKMTSRMRELHPEMLKIREKYFDDKIRLQQETMALYKREKVNPASGCLPLFIQMPVFFALYKVLFVTIEMRQAPFFGWIKDLSVADPSNIFTLFGLIPWSPPAWLHIGVLPMLYCVTMVIQMRQQPKPTDPVQARTMQYMPYFLLIVFAKFPAGLVVYWTWSNMLSILQQYVISSSHKAGQKKQKNKTAA